MSVVYQSSSSPEEGSKNEVRWGGTLFWFSFQYFQWFLSLTSDACMGRVPCGKGSLCSGCLLIYMQYNVCNCISKFLIMGGNNVPLHLISN